MLQIMLGLDLRSSSSLDAEEGPSDLGCLVQQHRTMIDTIYCLTMHSKQLVSPAFGIPSLSGRGPSWFQKGRKVKKTPEGQRSVYFASCTRRYTCSCAWRSLRAIPWKCWRLWAAILHDQDARYWLAASIMSQMNCLFPSPLCARRVA